MLLKTVFVAAVLLWSTVPATAASDRQVLQGKVAKIAPLLDAKPKGLCFCLSASAEFQGRVGTTRQIVSTNQVFVVCRVDTFDSAGNDIGGFSCTTFMPLVK